jgi:hypothetical protein
MYEKSVGVMEALNSLTILMITFTNKKAKFSL